MLQRNIPTKKQDNRPDVRNIFGNKFQGFYADYYGAKTPKRIDDFTKLDPNILNETQAEIPNYFISSGQQLPPELASYYDKYFDTNKASDTRKTLNTVQDELGLNELDFGGHGGSVHPKETQYQNPISALGQYLRGLF